MRNIFTPKSTSDPGLGTSYDNSGNRVINRDGNFNIIRHGGGYSSRNLYHWLINMSWKHFFVLVIALYLATNAVFALLYLAAGIENIQGVTPGSDIHLFMQAFFFSAQTFTTVGYGALAPGDMVTGALASIESLAGLMAFAVATGILYGRFSRPTARILFSDKAVIAPYQGFSAFMIRIVNGRSNQMMDLKAVLMLTQMETVNGERKRVYKPLKLERDNIYLFPLAWTIVHPIDEESPFYGRSHEELEAAQFEVFALIQGFDDTFSQTVHARQSYRWDEIVWNAKFKPMQVPDRSGWVLLDVTKVGEYELSGGQESRNSNQEQEKNVSAASRG